MKNYGLVSIITPSYNAGKYIGEMIESIQSQSYTNWELIITDDCSTDDTREVIKYYVESDSRIKLFKLQVNSGAGLARNNSLKIASGRFIAFCDSDDRWLPDKLQKQLCFMAEKDCGFSYTSYLTCDDNGKNIGIRVSPKVVSYSSMLRDDKVGCLTIIYDTEKVGKIYLPTLRKRQDWAMKLKILEKCRVAYGMKEPLAIYRMSSDSLSRNKRKLVKYNIAVYTNVLKWSKVKAYLFFSLVSMPSYLLKLFFFKQINK